MAANPDAGGARYALRGVMRALLRAVVLSGLVAVGWLLGSGLSHADEDPGLPGTGLIHVINTGSSDADPSAGSVVHSTVARVLPAASAPRLAVQPAETVGILRPILHAVGSAKPLTEALGPVPRPLSGPAPHKAAVRSAAPAQKVVPVPPAAPTIAPAAVAADAAPTPVVTLVRHTIPTVVTCSPAVTAAQAVPTQSLLRNGPVDPAPASPPGSTSSPCVIGSTSSGASTKNAPDFTVHDSGATGSPTQPGGPLQLSGSDSPWSLSVKPSTSPD